MMLFSKQTTVQQFILIIREKISYVYIFCCTFIHKCPAGGLKGTTITVIDEYCINFSRLKRIKSALKWKQQFFIC